MPVPPGVGKTHLAISLSITAAKSGRRVYYGTLASLIESLIEARQAGNLARRLKMLTHPTLLVVDEIGYLPLSQDGAVLFFQLINARHERASTVLTSNKGFEEWGGVLGDEVMAAALLPASAGHGSKSHQSAKDSTSRNTASPPHHEGKCLTDPGATGVAAPVTTPFAQSRPDHHRGSGRRHPLLRFECLLATGVSATQEPSHQPSRSPISCAHAPP